MNPPDANSPIKPHKGGDEVIEVPAVQDAELQCIDSIRQVLEIFFPASAEEERSRVLTYCLGRWSGGSDFGPRRVRRFFPGPPPPGGLIGNILGADPKEFVKEIRAANEAVDRDELIPPGQEEREKK